MKYIKIIDKGSEYYEEVFEIENLVPRVGKADCVIDCSMVNFYPPQYQEVVLDHEDKPVQINGEYVCVGDMDEYVDCNWRIAGYINVDEYIHLVLVDHENKHAHLEDVYKIDHKPLHPTKNEMRETLKQFKEALKDIKEVEQYGTGFMVNEDDCKTKEVK